MYNRTHFFQFHKHRYKDKDNARDTNLWVPVDVLIDGSQGEAEVFLANNLLPPLLLLLPVLVVQLVEQLPGE